MYVIKKDDKFIEKDHTSGGFPYLVNTVFRAACFKDYAEINEYTSAVKLDDYEVYSVEID